MSWDGGEWGKEPWKGAQQPVRGGQSGKTCIVSWDGCLAVPSLRCSSDGAGGGWVLRLRFHHENYPIKAVDGKPNGGKKSIIRDQWDNTIKCANLHIKVIPEEAIKYVFDEIVAEKI